MYVTNETKTKNQSPYKDKSIQEVLKYIDLKYDDLSGRRKVSNKKHKSILKRSSIEFAKDTDPNKIEILENITAPNT